jgi:hypothetical protein
VGFEPVSPTGLTGSPAVRQFLAEDVPVRVGHVDKFVVGTPLDGVGEQVSRRGARGRSDVSKLQSVPLHGL